LQLTKEAKDYAKEEDAVENFLVDDSSSDENSDYNVLAGGKASFISTCYCLLLIFVFCY